MTPLHGLYLSSLLPHQLKGVEWLLERYAHEAGGVLGDDKGMGKAVQVAAFLAAIFQKKGILAAGLPHQQDVNAW